jgi:putative glutamine amidotransferase
MKPWIGVVTYHLADGRVSTWRAGAFAIPEAYVEALRRAGARSILLPPGEDATAEELLGRVDGLMLVGGGDIHPSRYCEEPNEATRGIEPDRDEFEIALLRGADRIGMPTFAICRGIQIMNVAFGGTLIQHLPDVAGSMVHAAPNGEAPASHLVKIAPGSRLAGATDAKVISCSTHHHQGVDRLGEGLVPTGWTDDGLVEAVEGERGWMLGVQWHPEDTAADDQEQQAIFDAFVARAAEER